jgi:hypothetical protein
MLTPTRIKRIQSPALSSWLPIEMLSYIEQEAAQHVNRSGGSITHSKVAIMALCSRGFDAAKWVKWRLM